MRAPGYYVSVIDGDRRALVEGPFSTHAEALARVDPARNEWYEKDAKTWFYAWGTARVRENDPIAPCLDSEPVKGCPE